MKLLKIISLFLIISFGVFMVVFGEYDDSPGAQGLGLIVAVAASISIFRLLRKK